MAVVLASSVACGGFQTSHYTNGEIANGCPGNLFAVLYY